MKDFGRGDEFIIILIFILLFYKFTQFYSFIILSILLLCFWLW